jgi:predicted aspartyl protease
VIRGAVSPDGVPHVALHVAGQDWSAVIDTGFNGDLELPLALRPSLNSRFIGRIVSLLAGGQTTAEDCYLVDFPFDGQTVVAEATFVAGAEILIGTRMLQGHKLEIDFPAAAVRLERAP